MKTQTKVIIYDHYCPLCAAYTCAFVKAGLLTKDGRKNFNEIDQTLFAHIDKEKCNNEIPVIDIETKQVWYGIDALLEIINEKFPKVKTIGQIAPVNWLLKRIYKLISYNRKVIVAAKPLTGYDCSPDFNVAYRLIFLLLGFVFNTVMLFPYAQSIFNNSFVGESNIAQLQNTHLLFVLVNITCALCIKKKPALEYLGQVNMLAMICILLLLPLSLFNKFVLSHHIINNIYLLILTIYMVFIYQRRMAYAGVIPNYRSIVLINLVSVVAFITYLAG